ncbi:transposase [Mycobacterium vulneris]|nr:transposase [Mycolicibacterium vulneris]OCB64117.1 transposase [Mycolicibacterium vulneris]
MGWTRLPDSARAEFFEALATGLTPSAAATVAGIAGTTGRKWAHEAGYRRPAHYKRVQYSRAAKDAFWKAMWAGHSPKQAAMIAGVSEPAAVRWVKKAGYVPRTAECLTLVEPKATPPSPPRPALSFLERCRMEELLEQGYIAAEVARFLGRHRSTIGREIGRGLTASGYRAHIGQAHAEAQAKRPKLRTLQKYPALWMVVLQGLHQRHSPDQIAGRLRQQFPEDPEMWVSHETIYQALYLLPRGELAREVKAALRAGRIVRKPQGRTSSETRGQIKDMVNISERPAEAADRAVPGHWEGDLIIGAEGASQIGTLVERTTGFLVLLHLPADRTAETVAAAMTAKIPEIPDVLRLSLTWDQGKEMAFHTKITQATGLPIYFADPHSPWQRGTNENTNGLLRQYFPKGTDLSFYGPGWLDNVAAELNARPRKRLGYRTPAEELDRLLSNPTTFVAATA